MNSHKRFYILATVSQGKHLMGIADYKEVSELNGLITRRNVGTGFYQLTPDGAKELQRYQSVLSSADAIERDRAGVEP